MNFRKIIISLFSLLLLFGCTKKDDIQSQKLSVMSDLVNIDASFYKGKSKNYAIPCLVVTNQSLEGKEITFSSDINYPIAFTMLETKERSHEYSDFLVSKKPNWQDIINSKDSNKQEDISKAENDLLQEYENVDMGMKDTYVYKFELNVEVNNATYDESNVFHTIKMMVDDEEFIFDIGKIQFIKQGNEAISDDLEQLDAFGRIGISTIANSKKAYQEDIDEWLYKINNDITITDIIPLVEGQEIKVETIRVLDENNNEKDIPWNKQPIKLKKGSMMTINPYFSMADNKEIIYHQSYNYKIVYMSGGKEYSHIMESGIISTKPSAYQILNEKDLKAEYQKYFFDVLVKQEHQ